MAEQTQRQIGSIILAAGKGKRMQHESANKVTLHLGEKPMIQHIVDFMRRLLIKTIAVVVGYQKDTVIDSLKGQDILFVEQVQQLGTGHAVSCALEKLPTDVTDVLVVYGDDAVLYTDKNVAIVEKLFTVHNQTKDAMTFLTIVQDNPFGLGRIVRDDKGKILAIVEEKDATEEQRKITEINPGCFVFSVEFLRKYLPLVERSPITGEYYLTSLIDLAIKDNQRVDTLAGGKLAWRGVNTKEELEEAERLYKNLNE
jgi:bifunctional UDP-N-acetylglucosamine pyrophosphorylase / glucosamine-1-phosphate N-acetyltransferase